MYVQATYPRVLFSEDSPSRRGPSLITGPVLVKQCESACGRGGLSLDDLRPCLVFYLGFAICRYRTYCLFDVSLLVLGLSSSAEAGTFLFLGAAFSTKVQACL